MADRLFSMSLDQFGGAGTNADLRRSILAVAWDKTAAGPIPRWPEALRATVRTVLHAASPMAVLIGREGIVVCNHAAREIFGDAFRNAQGRSIFETLPVAQKFYMEKIDDAYRGKSDRLRDQPIKLLRGGEPATCWFNLGLSPIMGDDGEVYGTLLAASETTEHVRTRRALTLAQQRVEAALEAGGIIGTWDFDVRNRKVVLNGALAELYGISSEDARRGVPIETLFENLHDDDRRRVFAAVDQAVSARRNFHSRFRTVTPDGALHWYVASGRSVFDDAGSLAGFAGIVIDTTNHSEVTAALEASNLRFDTLVEAIPQIVWSTDRFGNHDFFNKRWTEFTGIAQADITPALWTELVHPDDWERVSATWQECLETGRPYDIDYRFRHHRDGYRWLRVIALPMRGAQGEIVRWYGTSTDIEDAKLIETERVLVNRELDHRIGNLFALVNGLINLSERDQPHSASFARNLRGRLSALHNAHQLIKASTGGTPVPLGDILNQVLAPYTRVQGCAISVNDSGLLLKAEAASSFALVFHELATNSAKYGALGSKEGRLSIDALEHPDEVTIVWLEDGGENPQVGHEGGGFGTKLLTAIVQGQLRGTFERVQIPSGMRVALAIPRRWFGDD